MIAAAAATISAQVALFAIRCKAVADNVLTLAMLTQDGDGNHNDVSLPCHP